MKLKIQFSWEIREIEAHIRISELEDKTVGIIKYEEQKEKKTEEKRTEPKGHVGQQQVDICIVQVPEEEERKGQREV